MGHKRDHRVWQPEELELVSARTDWGDLTELARKLNRPYPAIIAKRRELLNAAKARQTCGAFLPDRGVPYSVVMMRLLANCF